MNTTIKRYTGPQDEAVLSEAAAIIRKGGLVAFPTETVYGLGANALDGEALSGIFKAKGRPGDNPLIVHIASLEELHPLVAEIPPLALQLAEAFWPGPLTMIFRKSAIIPQEITCGLPTVAVRFPAHPVAVGLIKAAGRPIAAPSANTSGRPSPTKATHVAEDLTGKIDMLIDGGPCAVGLESTVIDMTVTPPCILRPGGVTPEMLEAVIGTVQGHGLVVKETHGAPKAPGMKYTHYAPVAPVTVVCGPAKGVAAYIQEQANAQPGQTGILATAQTMNQYGSACFVHCLGDRNRPETIAAGLFDALRTCDLHGVDRIFAEGFETTGIGLAIMNRLLKAAGGRIIHLPDQLPNRLPEEKEAKP